MVQLRERSDVKSATEKKKMGRPVIGKPKDIRIALRMDEDTLKKLDDVCKEKKISRSELVRQLINEMK